MKIQILFYSFGGSTRKNAIKIAEERRRNGNEVVCTEVTEIKMRSNFNCFLKGCPQAMKRKKSEIIETQIISDSDRYIIGCPIWAGFPAPAFNSIIELIPKNS